MAGSIGLRGRHVGIICPACAPELRYDTAMAIDEAEIQRPLEATAAAQPVKPPKPHWALTAIGIATVLALCYWA